MLKQKISLFYFFLHEAHVFFYPFCFNIFIFCSKFYFFHISVLEFKKEERKLLVSHNPTTKKLILL